MFNYIYRFLVSFLILIIFIIFYLSYVGLKTDRFNDLISKRVNYINPKIKLSLNEVYIKLIPRKLELKVITYSPEISSNNAKIKIKNIETNISLLSFISKKNSLRNISIVSQENNIKNVLKFVRLFQNNIHTILADKFINRGTAFFNINLFFNEKDEKINNFEINGLIKDLKFIYNTIDLETDFTFKIDNNIFNITNSKINYNGYKFISNNIQIKKNKNNSYNLNGDIENNSLNVEIKKIKNKNFFLNNILDNKLNLSTYNNFSFNLTNTFKVKNFKLSSEMEIEKINYRIKSDIFKEVFKAKENKLKIFNNKIKLDLKGDPRKSGSKIVISSTSNLIIDNKKNKLKLKINSYDQNNNVNIGLDIKNIDLNFELLDFEKKQNIPGAIDINFSFDEKKIILIKHANLKSQNNNFQLKNLEISKNLIFYKIENVNLDYKNNKDIRNKISLKSNGDKYRIIGSTFDASNILNKIIENKKKKKYFENLNESVYIELKKVYIDNINFILNPKGNINFNYGEIKNLEINSIFPNNKNIKLNIKTNNDNLKITNLSTKYPKPLISRYKFIKGFEDGVLNLRSIQDGNLTNSVLIIDNFKVKEVPALAKILTLASLQGIADLLTGEGIRFTDFEMKFSNENNLMKIEEIYAIGPAISLLMSGYIEKNKLVSLRGTLVPATTINRTISSIPVLGDILVGKKIGEGVFGVSFKIKGEPNNLKTTVNPLKTLTPRFITRTLEKIKKN